MATTPNYGWVTPAPTDFVTDLPADFETFADAADATVKALNPGTTAGDLDYYTSGTAKARLAIGTAGQVLTVNSGATAPEWGTLTGGGFTEIASTTFNDTASSVTYSSLGSYKHIFLTGQGLSSAGAGILAIWVRFNSDTANNYSYAAIGNGNGSASVPGGKLTSAIQLPNTLALTTDADERHGFFTLWIPNYASNQVKTLTAQTGSFANNQEHHYSVGGNWDNTAAITSITLTNFSATNFKTGIIKVYGVN